MENYERAHPEVFKGTNRGFELPGIINEVGVQIPEQLLEKERELSPTIIVAVVTEEGFVLDPVVCRSANPDLDSYFI